MKQVVKNPKEGQFVAVWDFNDEAWFAIYLIEEGKVYHYDCISDEFKEEHFVDLVPEGRSYKVFVSE